MDKQKNKICKDVEDFLSCGGQVKYYDYADERMMAILDLEGQISSHYIDLDFNYPDVPKQKLFDREGFEVDNCYYIAPLPRME